jgi:hypothetical protein
VQTVASSRYDILEDISRLSDLKKVFIRPYVSTKLVSVFLCIVHLLQISMIGIWQPFLMVGCLLADYPASGLAATQSSERGSEFPERVKQIDIFQDILFLLSSRNLPLF